MEPNIRGLYVCKSIYNQFINKLNSAYGVTELDGFQFDINNECLNRLTAMM